MFQFLKRLFGSQTERSLKSLKPILAKIKAVSTKLETLSHDEFREKSRLLREEVRKKMEKDKLHLNQLEEKAEACTEIKAKTALFQKRIEAEEKYYAKLEVILSALLPEAFAIVKETAKRFKENEILKVTATPHDRTLAQKYEHITIKEDKAYWKNSWDVAGNVLTWNMVHYDVQLIGGIILHQGKIAEMGTGEGKTLVASLPAFLNALSGEGVHVVTVNDYLARRDASWMGPLFEFHGISVDCIENTPTHSLERKNAYQADVTYGTNNQFGFDYLRDNMATSLMQQVQRGHHYAIVDEIDSVLIDDARTPLIISGPAQKNTHQVYFKLNPKVKMLYFAQKKLAEELLQEAKKKIEEKKYNEGGLALFRAYRALPAYRPLISFLSEKGMKRLLAKIEDYYLQDNSRFMPEADEPLYFTIDQRSHAVDLTDKGIDFLSKQQQSDDQGLFILSNMSADIAALEHDKTLTKEEKIAQKKALMASYSEKAARIHAINQLLKAYALYEKNQEYIVVNKQVKIVDEKTGRILEGRRYSDGLHQAIEAKEGVKIEGASQTYATITPQNQFRMYRKLSGMTGTASTEAGEMWEIYRLEVVPIPPNKPIIRKDLEDRLFRTEKQKFEAIVQLVREVQAAHRPVLLITPSVEVSEYMRRLLGIAPERVLNAKNHLLEAQIIAEAGKAGQITIATQMAGRGTDIQLTKEATEAGGLFVVIVEKHESRSVNNQARGRAGRQGDPGTTVCYLSLEDPLVVHWQHSMIGRQVDKLLKKEQGPLHDPMITNAIVKIQKAREHSKFMARKRALEFDNVLNKQRNVIYKRRMHALSGKQLDLDVMHLVYNVLRDVVIHTPEEESIETRFIEVFGVGFAEEWVTPVLLKKKRPLMIRELYHKVINAIKEKMEKTAQEAYKKLLELPLDAKGFIVYPVLYHGTPFPVPAHIDDVRATEGRVIIPAIQGSVMLNTIDQAWTEHLQTMDELKESVRNATYEQKDPLLIFKAESLNLFKQLIDKINRTALPTLLNFTFDLEHYSIQHAAEGDAPFDGLVENKQEKEDRASKALPVQSEKQIARNERVTVTYQDGTVKEGVKYKTVETDILAGKCQITSSEGPSS